MDAFVNTVGQTHSISDWLSDHPEVEVITVATPDINGVLRAKAMPARQASKIEQGKAAVPLSMPTVDFIGEEIPNCKEVLATGDGDIFVRPVARAPFSSVISPETAIVMVDMFWENGRQVDTSCRHILRNVIDAYANAGLRPVAALELEFYLYDPSDPGLELPRHPSTGTRMFGRDPCHLYDFEVFAKFFSGIRHACQNAGIDVVGLGSENGTAMFEVNIAHTADILKAADDLTILRMIIRDVARQHGYGATFMPKPFADLDGAGLHLHFSVLDAAGTNIFDGGTSEGSGALRSAVSGLITHAEDMQLVMAPHYSSYRRLRGNAYAPIQLGWGYDNRFLPVRIPAGNGSDRRIEHRIGGADANPYLLTALVLQAALDGISAGSEPPEPIRGAPNDTILRTVPTNMPDAIDAFAQSAWIKQVIPPLLFDAYLAAKQQEYDRIAEHVSQFEIDVFRDRI